MSLLATEAVLLVLLLALALPPGLLTLGLAVCSVLLLGNSGILERDVEEKIPGQGTELVLYCGGGFRSALAADMLQKMGYTNVWSMDGGFRGWKEAGLPIEQAKA